MSFFRKIPTSSSPLCVFLLCYYFFRVFSLASSATNNGGFIVDLIHRDFFLHPSINAYDRLRHAIERSVIRKSTLSLKSATKSEQKFQSTLRSGGGEYLMKVSIGTPPVDQYGIADTGSDLTWMQCLPCARCYKQLTPFFNPRKSKTYKKISCNTNTCDAAGDTSCGVKDRCTYDIIYGDGSHSGGDLSEDTFTFTNATFPKTHFGCSHETSGTFSNLGCGIIGLGGGNASIIKQLHPSINGKFSYCLTDISSNAASKITFGDVSSPNAVRTPIVKKDPITYYYLTLEAISVDNQRFEYKSKTIASGPGNIIIDSGTTATFLDGDFVVGLEAAVSKMVKGERAVDKTGQFTLCYKQPIKVPKVAVHFKGADVVVPAGGAFVEVEKGVVCLGFMKSSDIAIFGNLQQMNYEVGYDVVKGQVSFLPADCSNHS